MARNTNNNLTVGKLFKYIGFVLILLGGLALWILVNNDIISIDIFSVMSIPVSLGIASFAIGISLESDKRMKTLAEDTFLAVAGILEDRRLSLKNKRLQLEYMMKIDSYHNTLVYQLVKIDYTNTLSFGIWKCFTDLERVKGFRKYMKKGKHLEDKQGKIVKYLMLYYEELIIGRNLLKMDIDKEYKKHIKWMFEIIEKFEVYPIAKYDRVYELMLELQK